MKKQSNTGKFDAGDNLKKILSKQLSMTKKKMQNVLIWGL